MKLFLLLAVGLSTLLPATHARAGFAVQPDIPVVVNGTAISEKQLLAEIDSRINAQAAAEAQKGLVYDESSRNNTRSFMRDNVLRTLIERQLIADQLKVDHREISDADVDARFLLEAQQHNQTLEQAEQTIARQGQTVEQIKAGLRQTMGVERLYQLHASDPTDASEADAKSFYDANPHYFEQPEQRRVSRILFRVSHDAGLMVKTSAKARAEQVLQRVRTGEDFSALANTFSDDDVTKSNGGDRGWSARGWVSSPNADPFGNAAFAISQVGQVSPVVETKDGYEIILLTGIKPARLPPFDEVKASIQQQARFRKIGEFWNQYGNQLWAKAKVQWSSEELARQAEKDRQEREYVKKMDEQAARNAQ